MAAPPSPAVLDAFLAPTSHLARRIEIFENDGTTPWRPEVWESLVDGTVSVDYDRGDRRNGTLTLDNFDGALDHRPNNLWYDKVFKIFYGIHLDQKPRQPSICIVEEYNSPGQALLLKGMLNSQGYTRVRVAVATETYSQVSDFDILISISSDYNRKLAVLTEAFNNGKSILCFSITPTAAQLPFLIGTAAAATRTAAAHSMSPNPAVAHPAQTGWTPEWVTTTPFTHRPVTAVAGDGVPYARLYDATAGVFSHGAIAREIASGARWIWIQHAEFGTPNGAAANAKIPGMVGSAVKWLDSYQPMSFWETQIGELIPEQIGVDSGDERLLNITLRDYATRCMASKLATATTFVAGTAIETLIKNLASNSYCFKTSLPVTGKTLAKNLTYEAGKTRWEIMSDIATTYGYELFFNGRGFLTMRPFQDPLLSPASLTLDSGPVQGNLVSRSETASGSRIRNHIIVKGESSDSTVLPVWAEAKNVNPASPSSIAKLGDRVEIYSSALYVTYAQCRDAAESFLRVASLEEFEMSFEAILFPWVEVGEILQLGTELASGIGEPEKFMISSISFPLGELGPMTGNGKRVTLVV